MKIKPEVLLSSKNNIVFKKILITGSDESFINYVKNFIITGFKERNFFIDVSNNYNSYSMGGLFTENKTLFVLSDFPTKKESKSSTSSSESILVASPNGKKTNAIKSDITNKKECLVVECYLLNRSSKENTLKNFIETNKLNLSSDVFWYVVENFDDSYVIFKNQLEMLCLFNKRIDSISDIEKITFIENKLEINKIFFNIFKEKKIIISCFNKSINSLSDFYIFLNSIKTYLEIIKNSNDKESALYSFPKYLFAEKDTFITIHNKINKHKLIKIYRNISRVEILIRQNSELYLFVGLRFFLNLKKIITS